MNLTCSHCDKPFIQNKKVVTVCSGERMHLFCSIKCRDLYGFRKLANQICAGETCSNRVPAGNKLLCPSCYQKESHLGEPDICFSETEIAHWERMEQSLLKEIESEVLVYSAQEMTQEELRSLVPSLEDERA